VITANQATIWAALRLVGRRPVGPGQSLLESNQSLLESNQGLLESNQGLLESNQGLLESNQGRFGSKQSPIEAGSTVPPPIEAAAGDPIVAAQPDLLVDPEPLPKF
jgi:hypothetical protein